MKFFFPLLIIIGFILFPIKTIAQKNNFRKDLTNDQYSGYQQNTQGNQKGLFNKLSDKGIYFGLNETLEGYYNFTGGIQTGFAWASTFDANINLDLWKLLHWKGATVYADLEDHRGDNPTPLLLGDAQVFDKHNAEPFTQILELWYEQRLFNDNLRIKIGKVDANTEFSVIDNGLEFINSTTQVSPTFFVFPTFPDPMPSVNVFFTPGQLFYTSFAVYDANQKAGFLEFSGKPSLAQPTTDGILLISESGFNWRKISDNGFEGNFKLGLWKHTGTFLTFEGNTNKGTQGLYLIFDQKIWKPRNGDGNRGLGIFLLYALTSPEPSPIDMNYGGGICWNGPFDKRPDDVCGISVQEARLSPGLETPEKHELNTEVFYKLQLSNWIDLKPDVQYIINPGGLFPSAFVGILALNLSLNSHKE